MLTNASQIRWQACGAENGQDDLTATQTQARSQGPQNAVCHILAAITKPTLCLKGLEIE